MVKQQQNDKLVKHGWTFSPNRYIQLSRMGKIVISISDPKAIEAKIFRLKLFLYGLGSAWFMELRG